MKIIFDIEFFFDFFDNNNAFFINFLVFIHTTADNLIFFKFVERTFDFFKYDEFEYDIINAR